MSNFSPRLRAYVAVTAVALLLASCKNFDHVYSRNFDFPPADSTKFAKLDEPSGKLFDLLTDKSTGIDFSNRMDFKFLDDNNLYVNYYNGGGVAVMNINGDSMPDLYMTGNKVADQIYVNEGNMHFKNASQNSGILQANKGWSTGVAVVDINNDGFDDVYVCRSRWKDSLANLFYINNGNGTFTEKGKEYGIECADSYTMGAVFFDYDNDGDLDLYVKNHPSDFVERMRFNNLEKVEQGKNQSDRFFRNDGNGKFTDVSKEAGINNHGYGLAICAADVNDDGWMDVYGCNDFAMYDYLYINNGNGTFTDHSGDWLSKSSMFSMGVDIADVNNDAWQDIVTCDMRFDHSYMRRSFALGLRRNEFSNMVSSGYHYQYVKNALHINNGNNTYSEIANLAGVDATDWSWGPLFCDYDNDGLKDLFIPNGYYRWLNIDERELYQAMRDATRRKDSVAYNKLYTLVSKKKLIVPNYIYKNNGNFTFTNEIDNWGCNLPSITHGAALVDLDMDGDMDMVTSVTESSTIVYRNNSEKLDNNHYIRFKLTGTDKNINAIGSKIYIYSKSGMQMVQHHVVRGYQSTSEDIVHFGLAKDDTVYKVIVIWPDQKTQVLKNLAVNQVVKLDHKNATNEKIDIHSKYTPIFADASAKLGIDYKHVENEYEDFKKELLLPHKMSRFGPGLAVADVNGDGLEDFFVSGAVRSPGELNLQTANKTFIKAPSQPWTNDKATEQLGVLFFDADGDGDADLYLATGGGEFSPEDPLLDDMLFINDGKGNFTKDTKAIPDMRVSGSCVVAGDYDNDGDLDLFVGGRVIPTKYPLPAKSAILRNDKGVFTDVTKEVAPELEKGGLVCGAIWTDYNADNKLDLMILGEWMPVTVYKNTGGKFSNATAEAGLADATGWWNSIISGDFDSDGDIDYVAGNEGLNSRYYHPSKEQPVELFSSDFDKNGTNDIVLSVYNYGKSYPVKTRMTMTEQIPMIGDKFKLYKTFALATTEEVFGKEALAAATHYTAKTLASSYIENLGDGKFAVRELPMEAQFSCLYGMITFDINNDGNLDLIAHGNFFSPESETEKQDACIGLTMLGDGKGNFKPLPIQESGFFSDKDAKALAIIYLGKNEAPVLLGTNNNDKMFAYSFATNIQSKVALTEKDRFAEIFFKDGRKEKHENNIGSGYLSESTRTVSFVPSLVDKVVITDYQGQQRTAFQGQAIASK
ncbi:MAG: VCBS repeat-containing protein [Chitinophagales bacterium]